MNPTPEQKAKTMLAKYGKEDALKQAQQILYLSPSKKLDYWNKVLELLTFL